MGGGGGGFPAARLAIDGLDPTFGGAFLRLANGLGIAGVVALDIAPGRAGGIAGVEALGTGPGRLPGIGGGGAAGSVGGGGAEPAGARGMDGREGSESDCAPSAPVAIPPRVFFSFGIPPANMPPSCGGPSKSLDALPPPVSLLLRDLFAPPGTGGASPLGGFAIPGTGGAPTTGPPPPAFLSTMGAERSFVTVLFRRAPLVMSVNNAPCATGQLSVLCVQV